MAAMAPGPQVSTLARMGYAGALTTVTFYIKCPRFFHRRGNSSWVLTLELLKDINHMSNNCLLLFFYLIPGEKAVASLMPKDVQ